jgi:poly(ribitol-phosphate) beta-N-acetylglucosaminyltransferase
VSGAASVSGAEAPSPPTGAAVKVSVVVPVYNPGEHLEILVTSLRRQSMPGADFEVLFVDDGSTDGTGALLDRLADEVAGFQVIHIPNSGWPGKPRNVGLDAAVGEYVYFVDNDDALGDEALARMYRYATENGSDVVVGREIRRNVRRHVVGLFTENRPQAKLGVDPLLAYLTPHKMFRRTFLLEHGLRFPEGPRRL